MIELYFVGGPWDLQKHAKSNRPKVDEIVMRELANPQMVGARITEDVPVGAIIDHKYRLQRIGRTKYGDEIFAAIHEGID